MRVNRLFEDGRAECATADGERFDLPVQTLLLDESPQPGDWLLTHVDTAIRRLEPEEARLIADALEALARASRGEDFEHLLGDLIDREPQLPDHLRGAPDSS